MAEIIVGGVIEKEGKFLLVQEAKEKCKGKWNLPAGRLESKETIFEGAKREILEETGCKVELIGLLQIANIVSENDVFMSIVFSTKMIDENIKFDKKEILDVKWFTYEELLNMKNQLRAYDWTINSIQTLIENKAVDINILKIIKEEKKKLC